MHKQTKITLCSLSLDPGHNTNGGEADSQALTRHKGTCKMESNQGGTSLQGEKFRLLNRQVIQVSKLSTLHLLRSGKRKNHLGWRDGVFNDSNLSK